MVTPQLVATDADAATPNTGAQASDWRDYFQLLKPRVVALVVFTGAVGLIAAPVHVHPLIAFVAILAIALGAGAAGALNQWYEADLDIRMKRTASRPVPAGRIGAKAAFDFAIVVAVAAVFLMQVAVGLFAAALLLASILFYVVIYTVWLKRRTPQNIVIGGAAGAFPPLIGWVAATGHIAPLPILLFAIIFVWTPPHFWALAMFVQKDYANAGVPMLPLTHGNRETRRQIWLYSLALVAVTLAPIAIHATGPLYAVLAVGLGAAFLWFAWGTYRNTADDPKQMKPEKRLFGYSILYLFFLFAGVAVDALIR
jgi:protoheme IX farnesyltransferase